MGGVGVCEGGVGWKGGAVGGRVSGVGQQRVLMCARARPTHKFKARKGTDMRARDWQG